MRLANLAALHLEKNVIPGRWKGNRPKTSSFPPEDVKHGEPLEYPLPKAGERDAWDLPKRAFRPRLCRSDNPLALPWCRPTVPRPKSTLSGQIIERIVKERSVSA